MAGIAERTCVRFHPVTVLRAAVAGAMLTQGSIGTEGREMDTESRTSADAYRTEVYRNATDVACSERREIQAEISDLAARMASLQAREASLNVLVHALRELLPALPEAAAPYVPSRWAAESSPTRQSHSLVDADLPHRIESGTS
jgi:hypothetical protein